jgi:hypothetical protein
VRRWVTGSLVVVLAAGAACADESDDPTGTAPLTDELGAESSPFVVDGPEGYELLVAGTGTYELEWGGGDAAGNDEPLTVLAPPGEEVSSDDAVFVSTTGFEGYQGGLEEALSGGGGVEEDFEVDGRRALYTAAGGWHEVLATVGDDLAVRVRARTLDRDELVDVVGRTEVSARHAEAPAITDPPEGLHVLGSLDADVTGAWTQSSAEPGDDRVPGPTSAHSVVFQQAGRQISVMTLPGRAGDVVVAGAFAEWWGLEAEVSHPGDRPETLAVVDYRGDEGDGGDAGGEIGRTDVFGHTPEGDLLFIVATGSREDGVADHETLLDVARSVREASADEWSELIEQAGGGPGLHADPTAVELARAEEAGVEWLFQAVPARNVGVYEEGVEGSDELFPDPCLKLSTGERACADVDFNFAGDDAAGGLFEAWESDDGFPAFLVVWTELEGAEVEVVLERGSEHVQLHPIDGSPWRGAVVFADVGLRTGIDSCAGQPGQRDYADPEDLVRIDILDDDGEVLGCITGD